MRAPHRCWCLSATVADFRRTFAISVTNDVRCVAGVQPFRTGAGVQAEVGADNRAAVDVRRSSGGGSQSPQPSVRAAAPAALAAYTHDLECYCNHSALRFLVATEVPHPPMFSFTFRTEIGYVVFSVLQCEGLSGQSQSLAYCHCHSHCHSVTVSQVLRRYA
jgi:hypothetical protein